MEIAFDAKRAYQNGTGLGHYSRTLISSLAAYYPKHHYYLCTPKLTTRYDISAFENITNIVPTRFFSKKMKSLWRSNWIKKDLLKKGIDLYHGLSHEIPVGIHKTGIKSLVTIHDLIFERNPEQYNKIDVQIYRQKFKYACNNADHIIAISRQTKEDVINFYNIAPEKISICYQSCNPAFAKMVTVSDKIRVKEYYHLPDHFFLYVGSVIERKNLLNICKALHLLNGKAAMPLVVIGDGGKYKSQVKQYIADNGLDKEVIFLSDTDTAKNSAAFKTAADFPAIYQLAEMLIYPSFFEGFGIPVLEALCSKTPVITSNISCLPEAGGDGAYYVDPYSPNEIAAAMMRLTGDKTLTDEMKQKGWLHAQKFTSAMCAEKVMEVYLRL